MLYQLVVELVVLYGFESNVLLGEGDALEAGTGGHVEHPYVIEDMWDFHWVE